MISKIVLKHMYSRKINWFQAKAFGVMTLKKTRILIL